MTVTERRREIVNEKCLQRQGERETHKHKKKVNDSESE